MLILSHRGHMEGRGDANHPDTIKKRISEGFYVEVDLHWDGMNAFFGHDEPSYPVKLDQWDQNNIFFHLKTPRLPALKMADAFAIENDRFTITLRGYIWANYGTPATSRSIVCSPELVGADEDLENFICRNKCAAGICTDFPRKAHQILKMLKDS